MENSELDLLQCCISLLARFPQMPYFLLGGNPSVKFFLPFHSRSPIETEPCEDVNIKKKRRRGERGNSESKGWKNSGDREKAGKLLKYYFHFGKGLFRKHIHVSWAAERISFSWAREGDTDKCPATTMIGLCRNKSVWTMVGVLSPLESSTWVSFFSPRTSIASKELHFPSSPFKSFQSPFHSISSIVWRRAFEKKNADDKFWILDGGEE